MIKQADVFSDDWCDFIFDQRNKAYGAYELRKRYPDNVVIALLISVVVFGGVLSAPTVYGYFNAIKSGGTEVSYEGDHKIINPPPPVEPVVQIIEPIKEIPVLKKTIVFTPPKIVENDAAPESFATDDQVTAALPGTTTQDGDDTGIDPGLLDDATAAIGTVTAPEPDKYRYVEQMPEYPGGESAMLQYINNNIDYPDQAVENGVEGIAYVSFTVNKEGKVADVNVARGFDRLCEQEAMRVIRSMPAWKPGKQNGRTVNVEFTIPVRFELN